jgi:hypothetical protein
MAPSSWQNEIKSSFERLSAKSAAAQAQIFKDSIEFMKQAGEKKLDMSAFSKTGTTLVTDAIAAYTQLHVDYASKLIDLGLSFTRGMLSSIEKGASGSSSAPAQESRPGAASSAFALQVSGMPGDRCQTAFILESTNKKPVVASFQYTGFIAADRAETLSVPLSFDPPSATLNPDEKIRIVLEVPIPLNAGPGQYEASAWINDVPEMNFKIVLSVMGGAEQKPAAKKTAAPAKKTAKPKKKKK